jgi:hypothetical protein
MFGVPEPPVDEGPVRWPDGSLRRDKLGGIHWPGGRGRVRFVDDVWPCWSCGGPTSSRTQPAQWAPTFLCGRCRAEADQ